MIKIEIVYLDVVLTFLSGRTEETVEIDSGVYKNNMYRFLTISGNKAFLEGDSLVLLKKDFDALKIHIKNNFEKVVTHLNKAEIYLEGIDAIKEEEKDEVLKLLLTSKGELS